ncbi:hypothetical protein HDV00_011185 [Rhizophlyctis rosea]|nr:hypothetical protein HDV00_011185 [Rhizophlyctis rosea]
MSAPTTTSKSLPATLECIEDTMAAFNVPYAERKLMQLQGINSHEVAMLHDPQQSQFHKGGPRVGHIFPLDSFMDAEETERIINNLTAPGYRARTAPWNGFEHDSGELLWEDAAHYHGSGSVSDWKRCTILSYDPIQKEFQIQWEATAKPGRATRIASTWVTSCEILPPWETPEGQRRKLMTAQYLRAEFEYYATVREWVAIVRPHLEGLISLFPTRHVEGILSRAVNSMTGAGWSTSADRDREGSGMEEDEDVPVSRPVTYTAELNALRNDYYNSQVRTALVRNAIFRDFAPLSVVFDSDHRLFHSAPNPAMDETPHEFDHPDFGNVAAVTVQRRILDMEGELVFLTRPIVNVLAHMKEELEMCLGLGVGDSLQGPVRYVPDAGRDSGRKTAPASASPVAVDGQKDQQSKSDGRRYRSSAAPRRSMRAASALDLVNDGPEEEMIIVDMDGNGMMTISPADFQKVSAVVKAQFVEAVHIRAPEIVKSRLKDGLETQEEAASVEDLEVGLSKVVSALAESYFTPLLRDRIMETYQLFKSGSLAIALSLQATQSATDSTSTHDPLSIDFSTPISYASDHISEAMTSWLAPVECTLPDGILVSTPGDHRYIENLCKDLISDSAAAATDYLSEVRKTFLPRIRSASQVLNKDMPVDAYLVVCKKLIRDIDQIRACIARQPAAVKRGIFLIRLVEMNDALAQWSEHHRSNVLSTISSHLVSYLQSFQTCERFFTLSPPMSFDEAKIAISTIAELKAALPRIKEQDSFIKKVHAFLEDAQYLLEDVIVEVFYRVYTLRQQLLAFLTLREAEVEDTTRRLRMTLDREMEMFWTVQKGVEEKLVKLLDDSTLAGKIIKEFGKTAPIPRLINVLKHITDAIEVGRAIRYKADCIRDDTRIKALTDIDGSLESRLALVNGLIGLGEDFRHWRFDPVAKLNITEVLKKSQALQSIVKSSGLLSSITVKAADEELSRFAQTELPVLRILTNPGLRGWHWDAIKQALDLDSSTDPKRATLRELTQNCRDRQMELVISELKAIGDAAEKESSVRSTIETVQKRFESLVLPTKVDGSQPFITLTSIDSITPLIESDLLALNMLNSSPSSERYSALLSELESDLSVALNILKLWATLQPLIHTVHSFFTTDQVRLQLATELKRFRGIEGSYKTLTNRVVTNSGSVRMLTSGATDLPAMLDEMILSLQKIVEDFQGWLDNKRLIFPRLFCLSDDELLSLVSSAKSPDSVSLALSKLFRIKRIAYKKDRDWNDSEGGEFRITGMESPEGENLMFRNHIGTRSFTVETWMSKMEGEMKSTLQEMLFSCLRGIDVKSRKAVDWERDLRTLMESTTVGQVRLLAMQVFMTAVVEGMIGAGTGSFQHIEEVCRKVIGAASELWHSGKECSWRTLISALIGYRCWAKQLEESHVEAADDFEWLNGLRYTHDEDDLSVIVHQSVYSTRYNFDYLGPSVKLPEFQSQSCVGRIWAASNCKLGIATCSSATGKTELIRLHLSSIGKFAIEYSLNKAVAPLVITRLMTGVASNVCIIFRNLDLLNSESFSDWTAALQTLRDLIGRKEMSATFFGRAIKLPPSESIECFATLSRKCEMDSEVVRKVRSQMRIINTVAPDLVAVSESLFQSHGYVTKVELGPKLGTFLKMAPHLLSEQPQYDFTIRMLKMIFGAFRRMYESQIGKTEIDVLVDAIEAIVRPKLLAEDLPMYKLLLQKAFDVNISITEVGAKEFLEEEHAEIACALEANQHILLIGKAGTGKTSLIRSAAAKFNGNTYFVRTEAVGKDVLLGFQAAAGFVNGLIEEVLSLQTQESEKRNQWLVFDGVDPDMIVHLYDLTSPGGTCLSSGKRVVVSRTCTIFVETTMILPKLVGRFVPVVMKQEWYWRRHVAGWAEQFVKEGWIAGPENAKLIVRLVTGCLDMFFEDLWTIGGNVVGQQVALRTLLRILESGIREHYLIGRETHDTYSTPSSSVVREGCIFALIWSVGAFLPFDRRMPFEKRLLQLSTSCQGQEGLQFWSSGMATHSAERSLFEMNFDFGEGKWELPESDTKVPMLVRSKVCDLLLRHGTNLLICGEVCGKRETILDLLSNYSQHMTHFHGRNDSIHASLRQMLLEEPKKEYFRPLGGKKLIIFVDDYTVSEIELLDGLGDIGGYWSGPRCFRKVEGVSAVITRDVNLQLQGLSEMSLRHFTVFPFWEEDTLRGELSLRASQRFTGGLGATIFKATVELYCFLQKTFRSIDNAVLQSFSLRRIEAALYYIMNMAPSLLKDRNIAASLWQHEMQREFQDGLSDRDEVLFGRASKLIGARVFQRAYASNVIFSDILAEGRGAYEPVSTTTWVPDILRYFETHGIKSNGFSMTTPRAMADFLHLDRIIRKQRGHVVLRVPSAVDHMDEVVRLSAAASGLSIVEFLPYGGLVEGEWQTKLRDALSIAAKNDQRVVFHVKIEPGFQLSNNTLWRDLAAILDESPMKHLWMASEWEDLLTNTLLKRRRMAGQSSTLSEGLESSHVGMTVTAEQGQTASKFEALRTLGKDISRNLSLIVNIPDKDSTEWFESRMNLLRIQPLNVEMLIDVAKMWMQAHIPNLGSDAEKVSQTLSELFYITLHTCNHLCLSMCHFEKFLVSFGRHLLDTQQAICQTKCEFEAALTEISKADSVIEESLQKAQEEMAALPEKLHQANLQIAKCRREQEEKAALIEQRHIEIKHAEETAQRRKREMEAELAHRSVEAARAAYEASVQKLQTLSKDDIEEMKRVVMLEPKSLAPSKIQKLQKVLESPIIQADRLYSALEPVKALANWVRCVWGYAVELSTNRKLDVTVSADTTVTDKSEVDHLVEEYSKLKKHMLELVDHRSQVMGRLALLNEVFDPSNTFAADNDPTSEAQWIQQAFHAGDDGVLFDDERVAVAHDAYQHALNDLTNLRSSLSEEKIETDKLLKKACDLTTYLNQSELRDLHGEASRNEFSRHALTTIYRLFGMRNSISGGLPDGVEKKLRAANLGVISQSNAKVLKMAVTDPLFQSSAFYDNKMAATTAVKPVEGCRAAFLVRDLALALHTYNARRERLATALHRTEELVKEAKQSFDELWRRVYGEVIDFWTFERIIEACRTIKYSLEQVDIQTLLTDLATPQVHPLLSKIIQVVCNFIGWEADVTVLRKWIRRSPEAFMNQLVQLKIDNPRTLDIIQTHLDRRDVSALTMRAKEQYCRVYVDLIKYLPEELTTAILSLLDDKALGRSAQVSTGWHNRLLNPPMWRWFSVRRGWGIAFQYPPALSWRKLYVYMTKNHDRVKALEGEFLQYIAGAVGLSAYKKTTTFLKKIPEYGNLERSSVTPVVDQVMQIELVNEIFNRVEQVFSAYLAAGDGTSTSDGAPAAQDTERNASLRHRKVIVIGKSHNGVVFPPVFVHELVLDKAHRLGLVHPAVGRLRRHIQHGQGRVHANVSLDMNIPKFPTPLRANQQYTFPIAKGVDRSVYVVLAQLVQIIHQYHHGKRMGKDIQFYFRFRKSIGVLKDHLHEGLKTSVAAEETLLGDTLLKACIRVFGGRFSFATRGGWRDKCQQIIAQRYLCRSQQKDGDGVVQMRTESSLESVTSFQENMDALDELITHGDGVVYVVDPWLLANRALHRYMVNGTLSSVSPGDPSFIERLRGHMKGTVPIWIANVATPGQISRILNEAKVNEIRVKRQMAVPLLLVHIPYDLLPDQHTAFTSILDFRHNRETLRGATFDYIMEFSKPDFHMLKLGHHKELQDRVESTNIITQQIVTRFCNTRINDDLMHDVILLRRQFRQVDDSKARLHAYESEIAPQYDPLYQIVDFVCDVQHLLHKLARLKGCYNIPVKVYLHFIESSYENAHKESKYSEPVAGFMQEFVTRVAGWLSQSMTETDQIASQCALKLIYLHGIGEVKQYGDSLEKLLLALTEKSDRKSVQADRLKELVAPFLGDMAKLLEEADASSFARIEQRLTDFQKLIAGLFYKPNDAADTMLGFITRQPCLLPHGFSDFQDFLTVDLRHQCIKLVFSGMPKWACHLVQKLSDDQAGTRRVVPVVQDIDKKECHWMHKLDYAAVSGEWLVIMMDSFYLSHLETIVMSKEDAQTDFVVWLICPLELEKSIPTWFGLHCQTIYQKLPCDPRSFAERLWKSFPMLSPTALLPSLLLTAYQTIGMYCLNSTQLQPLKKSQLPSSDEIDFEMGLRQVDALLKRRLPLPTVEQAVRLYVFGSQLGMILEPDSGVDGYCYVIDRARMEMMFTSGRELSDFLTGRDEESGGVTQASVRDCFTRLRAFRTLKHRGYRRMALLNKLVSVLLPRRIEDDTTSEVLPYSTEVAKLLRAIDYGGVLRAKCEIRKGNSDASDHSALVKECRRLLGTVHTNWLRRAGVVSSELTGTEKTALERFVKSTQFLQCWTSLGTPQIVDAATVVDLKSMLYATAIAAAEGGTIHRCRIDFSTAATTDEERLQTFGLINVNLVNATFEESLGVYGVREDTHLGLPIIYPRFSFANDPVIRSTDSHSRGPEVDGARFVYHCPLIMKKDGEAVDLVSNLVLPTSISESQLTASKVRAQNSDHLTSNSLTLLPAIWGMGVHKQLHQSGPTRQPFSRRITLYLTFSPDASNERDHVLKIIIPALQPIFANNGVHLRTVDLKSFADWDTSLEDYLRAASAQVSRADIFIAVIGAQLGPALMNHSAAKGEGKYLVDEEVSLSLGNSTPSGHTSRRPSHIYLFFRDPTFSRSVPKTHRHRFEPRNHTEARLIGELKTRALQMNQSEQGGNVLVDYPCFFSRIEGGEVRVGGLEWLQTTMEGWLREAVGKILEEREMEWVMEGEKEDVGWQKEKSLVVGRKDQVDGIMAAFEGNDQGFSSCVFLWGEAGVGKTTLVKEVGQAYHDKGYFVLSNFLGSWSGSSSGVQMVKRFFAAGFKLLFIIDAVDELDKPTSLDELHSLQQWNWLPPIESLNVHVWVNTRWLFTATSPPAFQHHLAQKYPNYQSIELKDISPTDRDTYLQSIVPPLEPQLLSNLQASPYSSRPLFLQLLSKKIRQPQHTAQTPTSPQRLTSIFHPLLAELNATHTTSAMSKTLPPLALSRNGLFEHEWAHLSTFPLIQWNLFFTDIQPYLCTTEEGRFIPFHSEFAKAIIEEFLTTKKEQRNAHRALADGLLELERMIGSVGKSVPQLACGTRMPDIIDHYFDSEAPVTVIVPLLCSVSSFYAIFEVGVDAGARLLKWLACLMRMLVQVNAKDVGLTDGEKGGMIQMVEEYTVFARWCIRWVEKDPSLIWSLAWNLGKEMGGRVREEAEQIRLEARRNTAKSKSANWSMLGPRASVGLGPRVSVTDRKDFQVTKGTAVSIRDTGYPIPSTIERVELTAITAAPPYPFAFAKLSQPVDDQLVALLPYAIREAERPSRRVVLTILTSGTVSMYELETYAYLGTVVEDPLLRDSVRACCLTPQGDVVCAMKDTGLCLIKLGLHDSDLHQRGHVLRLVEDWWEGADLIWEGSGVWTCRKGSSVEDKQLKWIHLPVAGGTSGGDGAERAAMRETLILRGICDDLVAISSDGTKVAILSSRWGALVVVRVGCGGGASTRSQSQEGLREVTRLKLSEEAFKGCKVEAGAFSVGNDILAVAMTSDMKTNNEPKVGASTVSPRPSTSATTITVYNIDTNTRLSVLKLPPSASTRCLAFSLDEKRLYIGFRNGRVSIADVQAGRMVQNVVVGKQPVLRMLTASWKGKERLFVGCGGEVVTCELKRLVAAPRMEQYAHEGPIAHVAVTYNGSEMASIVSSSTAGTLLRTSISVSNLTSVITHHTRIPPVVAFHHHNKSLNMMTGVSGSNVIIWDMGSNDMDDNGSDSSSPRPFRELLRFIVPHELPAKKAYIYQHPTLAYKLILLIWTWDGMLSAWMVSRKGSSRSSVNVSREASTSSSYAAASPTSSTSSLVEYSTYEIDASPAFEVACHVLADPPVSSDGGRKHLRILLGRYDASIVLDLVTGGEVKVFQTRDRDTVLDVRWGEGSTGGRLGKEKDGGKDKEGVRAEEERDPILKTVFYVTRSTLYQDSHILSHDITDPATDLAPVTIRRCLLHPTGRYIAYHGRQTRSSSDTIVLLPTIHPPARQTSANAPSKPIYIPHPSVQITHYDFTSDGKYLVTLGNDEMMRVFDVHSNVVEVDSVDRSRSHERLIVSYPLQEDVCVTCMCVYGSANANGGGGPAVSVVVGDADGRLVLYRLI